MKTTELRIGNLVNNGGVVVSCDGKTILDLWHNSSLLIDKYKPIPLAEEWLLKFGFDKEVIFHKDKDGDITWDEFTLETSNEIMEWYNSVKLIFEFNKVGIWDFYLDDMCDGVADIKYVHQLQNLYFALTGVELKYNA